MSGELAQLEELEKRHKQSNMIHWTEKLEGISPELKLKVKILKDVIDERNRLVKSIAVYDETINNMGMHIDRLVYDSGNYTNDELAAAAMQDTCNLIDL